MKPSPFVIYFAGVGTVVAALAVGFGGGLFLTNTSVVKETPAMSAARLERLRTVKVENQENSKKDDGATSTALLAATAVVPVNVKAPPAEQVQPIAAAPAPQPPAVAKAVQGQASFEGPNNAIEINLPKKPIAEVSRADRKRQTAMAQRKTREVIVQSRRDDDEFASEPAYRETRVVRTYEARSRGFGGGLFFSDDED